MSGVSTVLSLQDCTVLGHQQKAQNRQSESSRDCEDLNMKVRDVAASVTAALWLVSQKRKQKEGAP